MADAMAILRAMMAGGRGYETGRAAGQEYANELARKQFEDQLRAADLARMQRLAAGNIELMGARTGLVGAQEAGVRWDTEDLMAQREARPWETREEEYRRQRGYAQEAFETRHGFFPQYSPTQGVPAAPPETMMPIPPPGQAAVSAPMEYAGVPGRREQIPGTEGQIYGNIFDTITQGFRDKQALPVSAAGVPVAQMPIETLFQPQIEEGVEWPIASRVDLDIPTPQVPETSRQMVEAAAQDPFSRAQNLMWRFASERDAGLNPSVVELEQEMNITDEFFEPTQKQMLYAMIRGLMIETEKTHPGIIDKPEWLKGAQDFLAGKEWGVVGSPPEELLGYEPSVEQVLFPDAGVSVEGAPVGAVPELVSPVAEQLGLPAPEAPGVEEPWYARGAEPWSGREVDYAFGPFGLPQVTPLFPGGREQERQELVLEQLGYGVDITRDTLDAVIQATQDEALITGYNRQLAKINLDLEKLKEAWREGQTENIKLKLTRELIAGIWDADISILGSETLFNMANSNDPFVRQMAQRVLVGIGQHVAYQSMLPELMEHQKILKSMPSLVSGTYYSVSEMGPVAAGIREMQLQLGWAQVGVRAGELQATMAGMVEGVAGDTKQHIAATKDAYKMIDAYARSGARGEIPALTPDQLRQRVRIDACGSAAAEVNAYLNSVTNFSTVTGMTGADRAPLAPGSHLRPGWSPVGAP